MSSISPSLRRFVRSLARAALLVLLAAPLATAQFNRGGGPPVEVKPSFGAMRSDRGTENRIADLLKIHVRLKLDEKAGTFGGDVVNDVEWLVPGAKEIWFDADDMKIGATKVDGKEAPFRQEAHRVVITLPAPATLGQKSSIQIDYSVDKSKRGLWFIHPSAEEPALLDEIWSQGESEDNRRWIPMWDYPSDRAAFEGEFTVRDGLTVVSNGKLVDKKPAGDGWTTWHWSLDFPFATYLISLCVGHYERYADDWRGIPVEYYVQQGVGEAKARRSFGQTPDMLEFFSSKIGVPYPYPKYAQTAVQHFIAGGMENISATTQTDSTLHDEREHLDRDSQGLVAHELAHQWFGDYLTCRTWRHLWLNEGFADFFEALYREAKNGEDDFRLEMRNEQRSACASMNRGAPRPLVESFFNRAPDGDGNNAVYVRGSSTLHMIRTQLGDAAWWKAIHHYVTKHQGQLVDSNDFEVAIEEATGQNLHWLFEEYVYLGGHPKFTVTQTYDAAKKEVVLQVKQTQDTSNMVPVFVYPVPIEVVCSEGRTTHTVWINQKEQEVRLPAASAPLMVAFDSGNAMLKEIEFKKSALELAFIGQGGDSDAVARLTAVEQLAECDDKELARKALAVVLASKDQRDIRANAADGLAKLGGGNVGVALANGAKDPEARVRRACVVGLGRVVADLGDAKEAATQVVAEALRTDLSYNVQQAACETLGKLGGDNALVALRAATDFPSPNERVAGAALRARLVLADGMAVDEVFKLAARGNGDVRKRALGLAAMGGLNEAQMGGRRDEAIALLLDAAQSGASDFVRPAIQSLGELKAVEAEEVLKKLAERQDGPRFLPFVARNALRQIDEAKKKAADVAAAPAPKPPPTAEELAKTVADLQKQIEQMKALIETLKKPVPAPGPSTVPAVPVSTGGSR